MTAYIIGNFIGRLLVSYLIVWVVCFTVSQFDWRKSFTQAHGWVGIPATMMVFILGIAGSTL